MSRRRSVAAAPISNRETLHLLRAWGFSEVGGNGGHLVLALNGRNVQITAPGRNTPTPYTALRKAAKIAGVTLQDLMRGPTKKEKVMSASESKVAAPLGVIDPGPSTAVAVADPPNTKVADPVRAVTFKCPSCEREFDNLKSVRVHQRSHNMVRCRNCGTLMAEPARGPHEKHCVEKNPDGKLAKERAAAATPVAVKAEPEPEVKRPRGRPRGTTKKAMAARRAARTAPPKKRAIPAPVSIPTPAPVTNGSSDGDGTMDALIGVLFPNGIPGNLAAVTALSEWVTATERLLDATKS